MADLRAAAVLAAGSWTVEAADSVVLDFDDRHRRRIAMEGVRGLAFLLDLPAAVMLRSGDALQLEDGRLVEVLAAPEPLVEIRASGPLDLTRLAWHVGNRHVPAQLMPKAIRIRRDHVIEEMVASLGGRLTAIEAPFDPEGGAYAQHAGGAVPARDVHAQHAHEHHGHDHHGHDHHDHAHRGHVHDNHDHDHDHHDHGGHDHSGDDHGGHDHGHAHAAQDHGGEHVRHEPHGHGPADR